MTRISVLLPTRGRPDNVARLIGSAYRTAELPPEVWLYVDDDDPLRDATVKVAQEYGAKVLVGNRILLSQTWNQLAECANGDVLMHCGDDIIFRSHAWDRLVLEIFDGLPDKIGVVHGRDGYQDQRMATHGFYHRRWVEVLGYLVPPYFASDYNDLWNTEVADWVARRWYVPEVYTEHMHPVAGKAELDQTHRERLARHVAEDCDRTWRETAQRRALDVRKLRDAIESHSRGVR